MGPVAAGGVWDHPRGCGEQGEVVIERAKVEGPSPRGGEQCRIASRSDICAGPSAGRSWSSQNAPSGKHGKRSGLLVTQSETDEE